MASWKAISRLLEAAEDQEEVKSIGEREGGSRRKAEQNKEGEGNHHYARGERHLLLSSGLSSMTSAPKWGGKMDEIWELRLREFAEKGRMVQDSEKFADVPNGIALAG